MEYRGIGEPRYRRSACIFLKNNIFLAQMFLQLVLLPPLGHKEAIGTLGYHIASKLDD